MKKDRIFGLSRAVLTVAVLLLAVFCAAFLPVCAATAKEATVYVGDSGSDTASGNSPSAPLKTLSAAVRKLKDGGTVCVCGCLTVQGDLPEHTGKIAVRGENGASVLALTGDIRLHGDTEFTALTIASRANSVTVMGLGHDMTFGRGLTVTKTGSTYPILVGGVVMTDSTTAEEATFFDYTVRVESGDFHYVIASNRRTSHTQAVGATGGVSLIVNGGTFHSTDGGMSAYSVNGVGSYASQDGDYSLEITGGTFYGSVYGIVRPGAVAGTHVAYYRGDVRVKITGGTFKGAELCAVQNTDTSYIDGDYFLEVTGGNFSSRALTVCGIGVRGRAGYEIPEALFSHLCGFDRTVYVASDGNDAYSGASRASAVATLEKAAELLSVRGGTLVIATKITAKAGMTFGEYRHGVRITSVYGGVDYRQTGASLTVAKDLSFQSDVTLGALRLIGHGDVTLTCGGHDFTAEGDFENLGGLLSVDAGEGGQHTLTIAAGKYGSVCGGTGEDISLFLRGGTVETLIGAKKADGNVYVGIYGGSVGKTLVLSENDVGGSVSLSLYGGSIGATEICLCGGCVGGDIGIHLYDGEVPEGLAFSFAECRGKKQAECTLPASVSLSAFDGFAPHLFVSGDGTGDGSRPDRPLGRLRDAVKQLGNTEGGGTVVLCGPMSLGDWDSLSYPEPITVCSVYGGVDFRSVGQAELILTGNVTFSGPLSLDGLLLTAASDNTGIVAGGLGLEIGWDVECRTYRDGGIETYPDLVSGVAVSRSTARFAGTAASSVTVNGGTWNNVCFGNLRRDGGAATERTVEGDGSVTIGAGVFYGRVCFSGMNGLSGSLSVTVKGGSFLCPVYVIASPAVSAGDTADITGNVTVRIFDGDFHGDLCFAQEPDAIRFNGKYVLDLYGGDLRGVGSVTGCEGITGEHTSECNSVADPEIPASGTVKFRNPVVSRGADPSVYARDGWYYYTKTGYSDKGKPNITVARSANLCDIGAATAVSVWEEDGSTGFGSVWAPQLYFFDGKWYLYAACATGGSDNHFPYVWVSDSPMSGFTFLGMLENTDPTIEAWLSPRLMTYEGKLYYISAVFRTAAEHISGVCYKEHIIISSLSSPTAFREPKVTVIASPDKDWERQDIMEGVFPLVAPDGTLYLSYAANYTHLNDYCTGALRLVGNDLLDPGSWEKLPEPILQRLPGSGIYSPGAAVYAESPDGTELWAVYHAKLHADNQYAGRCIFLQRVTWDGNLPVLGNPAPLSEIGEMPASSLTLAERISGFSSLGHLKQTAGDGGTASSPVGWAIVLPVWGGTALLSALTVWGGLRWKKKRQKKSPPEPESPATGK